MKKYELGYRFNTKKRLIIDFRGTESQKDAAADLKASSKSAFFYPKMFRQKEILVHAGFLKQYISTRQNVRDVVMGSNQFSNVILEFSLKNNP